MKKFKKIIWLLLISLSFTSCDNGTPLNIDFDIFDDKEIVLGQEVNFVDFTTKEGETITFTNTNGFYEIFDEIGFSFEADKKYSCSAEMILGEQTKSYVNTNIYYFEDGIYNESRVKKEGSNDVALLEEYQQNKQLENNQSQLFSFTRYIYKNEQAFSGSESGVNGTVRYNSNQFPTFPEQGTELAEMWSRLNSFTNLLISTSFFRNYTPIGEMDFNQFVTREYKLYENYIVFKQTAPFLDVAVSGVGQDLQIIYNRIANSNSSITQEAYCNVKTGEIELIKAYGEAINYIPAWRNIKLEINMQMYIYDLVESDYQQKVDAVIAYIKANANK